MKKIGTVLLVLIMLAAGRAGVFGGPLVLTRADPAAKGLAVIDAGDGVFKIVYQGDAQGVIRLDIYDKAGRLVYATRVKGEKGFICPVNFGGMAHGTYAVRIIHGRERVEGIIDYSKRPPQAFYAKALVLNKRRYAILTPGVGHSKVSVRIYNSNSDLISEYTEKADGDFGKIFDLSRVPSSSFTFVVSSAGATPDLCLLVREESVGGRHGSRQVSASYTIHSFRAWRLANGSPICRASG